MSNGRVAQLGVHFPCTEEAAGSNPVASTIISTEFDGKRRKLYLMTCKACGKYRYIPKHRDDKCCSIECRGKLQRKRAIIECFICKKNFERQQDKLKYSKSGLFFCSRKCKDKAQGIEGGCKPIQPLNYKDGSTRYRKRALREYGSKCKECGYSDLQKMLDVDHIDNNRKNNKIENLQVLCVWCHALKTRKHWK